jgi:hypothetical protein
MLEAALTGASYSESDSSDAPVKNAGKTANLAAAMSGDKPTKAKETVAESKEEEKDDEYDQDTADILEKIRARQAAKEA